MANKAYDSKSGEIIEDRSAEPKKAPAKRSRAAKKNDYATPEQELERIHLWNELTYLQKKRRAKTAFEARERGKRIAEIEKRLKKLPPGTFTQEAAYYLSFRLKSNIPIKDYPLAQLYIVGAHIHMHNEQTAEEAWKQYSKFNNKVTKDYFLKYFNPESTKTEATRP